MFVFRSSLLQVMVRDPYGNYVVQKILDIADDRQQVRLSHMTSRHTLIFSRSSGTLFCQLVRL